MTHASARRPVIAALLALVASTGACHPVQPRIGEVPDTRRDRDSLRALPRARTATAREAVEKRVNTKRPPTTLVAGDDSWCTVSEEQYDRTRIGDFARCSWNPGTLVR